MFKKFSFKSILAPYMEGLMEEKRAMGYQYDTQGYLLKRFDVYWKEREGTWGIQITRESLEDWYRQRDTECRQSRDSRVGVVKELSRYMCSVGIEAYVPDKVYRKEKKVPYLLSDTEICRFFLAVDCYIPKSNAANYQRLAGEYRVLFRMIYCLGLRRSEACGLRSCDVDLKNAVVTIYHSKGDKDRLVYMTEDLCHLCGRYLEDLRRLLGMEPYWFFPGRMAGQHVSTVRVDAKFREFWKECTQGETEGRVPTLHCLRHKFVEKRVDIWMENGIRLPAMMPYLSRHLGHKGAVETLYYYHAQKESFRSIRKKDSLSGYVIQEGGGC